MSSAVRSLKRAVPARIVIPCLRPRAASAASNSGFRFRVAGRSDDMFRVRGVNVFPSSLEGLLRERGLDRFAVVLEAFPVEPPVEVLVEGVDGREEELARGRQGALRLHLRDPGRELPRTEAKAKRLYRLYDGDERP